MANKQKRLMLKEKFQSWTLLCHNKVCVTIVFVLAEKSCNRKIQTSDILKNMEEISKTDGSALDKAMLELLGNVQKDNTLISGPVLQQIHMYTVNSFEDMMS